MQTSLSDYSLSYADPMEATSSNGFPQSWDDARFESMLLRLHAVIDVTGLWSALQHVLSEVVPNDACVLYLKTTILATPKANNFRKWMEHRREKDLMPTLGLANAKPKVFQLSDVLFDPRQLCHAEFFRRYMAPESWHHIACSLFWDESSLSAEFATMRTAQQGIFTDYEMAVLNRLHPHIEVILHRLVALAVADTALPSRNDSNRRTALMRLPGHSPFKGEPLTPAESQLVHLLHTGLSNKEIAARLDKSVRTVKTQLTSIYRKYGVRSRTRLLATILGSADG